MHPEYMILLRVLKINNMKETHTLYVCYECTYVKRISVKKRRINIFDDPKLT